MDTHTLPPQVRSPASPSILVPRVADFEVTGAGDAPAWQRTDWVALVSVGGSSDYVTRAKLLYSATGLYVLMDCSDQRLTCSFERDNANLFQEDVVEVFFWPDESQALYLEYELSPLNFELPLLIPNHDGKFVGWLPGWYEGDRRCRHATRVRGGEKRAGATVSGWMAEMFIPFALVPHGPQNPPRPGMRWRANLYRIDYDSGSTSQWAWSTATGPNFHDFLKFGSITFGE